MRHKKSRYQLNRFTSWHKATVKSLIRSLLINQSIKTTLQRAKTTQPLFEKLISTAKKNTLAGKRDAFSILGDHKLVSLLFSDIAPRFANRTGGFTRIINYGIRRGDSAKLVIFELTEIKKKEVKKEKKAKETKTEEVSKTEQIETAQKEEKAQESNVAVKEKPPVTKKPSKKFLGGLRGIFKKERDSL
ncbi:MAG: 50S ribosomal protein L17 [Candidatus Omnitrophica bacterium]|nr:50S ribosomal protein L17 [Candidatus Omnitrophota bacterium]